jgi:hypothetical protein
MISLTRSSDNLPVASFGAGAPFGQGGAAAGNQTTSPAMVSDTGDFGESSNEAEFGNTGLFSNVARAPGPRGAPTGALTEPGLIEPSTRASTSTNQVTSTLGQIGNAKGMYEDPTKGHGIRGGGFKGAATPAGGKQLTTDEDWDTTGPAGQGIKKLGPGAQRLGRRGLDFAMGRYSSTPGALAADAAEAL